MTNQRRFQKLAFCLSAFAVIIPLNLHAEQSYSDKTLIIINQTGLPYHAQIRASDQTADCWPLSVGQDGYDCSDPKMDYPPREGTDKSVNTYTLRVGNCCESIVTEAYLWINGGNTTVCSHERGITAGPQVWKYTLNTWTGPDGKPRYGCY